MSGPMSLDSAVVRPVLTIVIVNWNGGELLLRCLESLRLYGNPRHMRVIVVDNASADGSREAAAGRFPEYRVINSGSNLGFGRANNLVRNEIESPFVLFLNPDTEVTAGTLDCVIGELQRHPEVGAVGCKMVDGDGTVQPLGIQWGMTPWTALLEMLFVTTSTRRYLTRWLPVVDPERSAMVDKLYGGFLMVRKAILDDSGWFDERYFMYAEDADLSRTIRARGWKLFYCADAVIMHVGGGTTASAPSGFSVMMKQESINKFIEKYQGGVAAFLHRVAVAVGSSLRLTVTTAAWIAALLGRNLESRGVWKARSNGYRLMLYWSLGVARARIPASAGIR